MPFAELAMLAQSRSAISALPESHVFSVAASMVVSFLASRLACLCLKTSCLWQINAILALSSND